MDSKTYQEANLQAVFLLNRMENTLIEKQEKHQKQLDYDYPIKSKTKREKETNQEAELALKSQLKTPEKSLPIESESRKDKLVFKLRFKKLRRKKS
jgi:hypothetical protein